MIVIHEVHVFGQTITAVLDELETPSKILSLKKGATTDHEWNCAEYHSERTKQDIIRIPVKGD